MHDELFSRNGLSLERLRAFADIVSAGGPTRAANGDATRQSQYSRQLKELEEFFGAELFALRGRRWVLTSVGRELRQLTNEHFGALAELRTRCARESVELRFGAGESFLQWRLLPKLARLLQELSDVRLVLLNRRSEDIVAGLLSGELEFGILPPDKIPASLKSYALPPVEFRFFVPRSLLVGCKTDEPDWALHLPLVLLEGNGAVSDALRAQASRHEHRLNVVLECSSHLQAVELVRQGLAAAVLPVEAHTALVSDKVELHQLSCLRKATRRISLTWNARLIRTRPTLASAVRKLAGVLGLDGIPSAAGGQALQKQPKPFRA